MFEYSNIIDQAIREVYNGQGGDVNEKLFNYYHDRLSKAVHDGFGRVDFESNPSAFENKFELENNMAMFSGLKAYHETSDMAKMLKNEDGSLRSFSEYRKDARRVNETYRNQWLRAEYNTTKRSAAMAAKWQDMWSKRDYLPFLQYVPSRAADPREEHKPFYGITLPITHPFWKSRLPPNGWGCMCSVKQMATAPAGITQNIPRGVPSTPGISGNAGASGRVFNLHKGDCRALRLAQKDCRHGYAKGVGSTVRAEIEKKVRARIHKEVQQMRKEGKFDLVTPDNIKFSLSRRGMKKTLQQPIVDAQQRQLQRRLLPSLPQLIMGSAKHISLPNLKPLEKPHAVTYHYYEIKISGGKFYLTIEENQGNLYHFYTIIDEVTMNELKKKTAP